MPILSYTAIRPDGRRRSWTAQISTPEDELDEAEMRMHMDALDFLESGDGPHGLIIVRDGEGRELLRWQEHPWEQPGLFEEAGK